MANSYIGNPWIIDTASATAITSDALAIDHLKWVPGNSAVAQDECKVTDNSATPHILMDEFATGADTDLFDVNLSKVKPAINGLIVSVLAHGKLYVYLR